MTPHERRNRIQAWSAKSSSSEQVRQARALRMVQAAIDAHDAFDGVSIEVYAKGSYANQTNVKVDSDVDIVVENHDCCYFEYVPASLAPTMRPERYDGRWEPALWRREVTAALVNAFGVDGVDDSGAVALNVSEVEGSRPNTDVVPSFLFERYDRADQSITYRGSKVIKKGSSGAIVNYPKQQQTNGERKDRNTGGRYKQFTRTLKSVENLLVQDKTIQAMPSYLMEALMYNVPNGQFSAFTLDAQFEQALVWLHRNLADGTYDHDQWEEPNELKWLFGPAQKWTVDDARQLVLHAWAYVYGD